MRTGVAGRSLLTLAATAALGCAAARAGPFRCPARGGPAWRELVSDHIVLRTDLPAAEAGEVVAGLERLRAAVQATLFPAAPIDPGRIEVIAFRSPDEYRQFAPAGADGYYLRYAGGPPRIVLASGALGPTVRSVLAHELTHHFLASVFPRRPAWFAEGLAVYMEALGQGTGGDPGTITLGAPPWVRLERARTSPVPARELLEWDGTGRRSGLDYYAEAFVLVHWLAHRRADGFAAFQARLAAGADPDAAWGAAFPDLDPARPGALDALDDTLDAYARGQVESDRRAIPVPVAVGFFEHAVPPEEVHAIRLVLWHYGPPRLRETLLAEVHEALAEDPAHPIALQVLATEEKLDPVVLARRAVAGHPGDARAWTFLGTALRREAPHEREAAFRRAAELAPRNPAALHNLAQELLAQGRSGEALPLARQATAVAPWSPPILAGHAAVLSDLGRCTDAIVLQRRALESLPERAGPESRTELLAGLEAYARQCRTRELR